MRRKTTEKPDKEWNKLKQFIACKIDSFSKDFDRNLELYCDVLGYIKLTGIVEDILRNTAHDENESDTVSRLSEVLIEAKEIQNTELIYNELIHSNQQNDNKYKWQIIKQIKKYIDNIQFSEFPFPPIILSLGRKYKLSNNELQIISIFYLMEGWRVLNNITLGNLTNSSVKNIAYLCSLPIKKYTELIGVNSSLFKKGIFRFGFRNGYSDHTELNQSLIFSLSSGNIDLITAGLYREEKKPVYTPEQFSIPELELKFIINTLKYNKSVLIAGEAGIGKTEFAYSIAANIKLIIRDLKMDSPFYSNRATSRSTPTDRMLMIRTASNLLNNKEVLLIDEADTILQSAGGFFGFVGNDGSYDKGELNYLLDDIHVPSIWITNSTERIPASSLRRFAYVYQFPHPNMKIRNRMLKDKLGGGKNISAFVNSISSRYDLTPSAMERMANIVISLNSEDSNYNTLLDTVESYLETASKGSLKHDFRKLPAYSKSFNPELSSTSIPLDVIIKRIQKRSKLGKASRLLFEGQPGGGKTQSSLYLASAIGKEAIIKKPSDLLSPYVGVAEQNINAMFRNAEMSEAVLIIDEADALLSDRSMAQRSWELSQASEFLQGIQDFKGILIACTNRFSSLDPAIIRRFHQKVTFGTLETGMIHTALKHLFPYIIFSNEDLNKIENAPPLMMSDIANASEILDIEENLESTVVVNEIIENAKNRDMSKTIGF